MESTGVEAMLVGTDSTGVERTGLLSAAAGGVVGSSLVPQFTPPLTMEERSEQLSWAPSAPATSQEPPTSVRASKVYSSRVEMSKERSPVTVSRLSKLRLEKPQSEILRSPPTDLREERERELKSQTPLISIVFLDDDLLGLGDIKLEAGEVGVPDLDGRALLNAAAKIHLPQQRKRRQAERLDLGQGRQVKAGEERSLGQLEASDRGQAVGGEVGKGLSTLLDGEGASDLLNAIK
ncbi:hypothetical protein MPH_01916 [Macrophomina phaseolina MS6]|uniref:Uncharacterized protein n=1 Tax=Macrophomina phaseolina (strain MS6) TaxID=1126212 RepID=K2SE89_MACPH|nr:hypothetical protein MPH_01916 [Macrophomina phaseolina MS6]